MDHPSLPCGDAVGAGAFDETWRARVARRDAHHPPETTDSSELPPIPTSEPTVAGLEPTGFWPIGAFTRLSLISLFAIACMHGVLEVHSSTDTWIGLTAGRAIMSHDTFPIADTLSYTFDGKTWFNQNWLTHVYFWLLYDHIGPNWVVYGTWVVGWGMFVLVLLAVRLRCGSWVAATMAASIVGFATRDWLSARPASVQFLCIALLWFALTALWTQGKRRRWWPLALIFIDFLAWVHAHGSFIFGYMLIVMFIGAALLPAIVYYGHPLLYPLVGWSPWLARRLSQMGVIDEQPEWRPLPVSPGQLIALGGVALTTLVSAVVLSPYGVHNVLHPFVVTESEVFRQVSEWRPPYQYANFPPVYRFWAAFAIAAAAPALAALMVGLEWMARGGRSLSADEQAARRPTPRTDGRSWNWYPGYELVLYDVAAVAGGLYMVMFARRFAPIFYILAAPAITLWIIMLGRQLAPRVRWASREALLAATIVLAIVLGWNTYAQARRELYLQVPKDRDYSLLERVTRFAQTPQDAVRWIRENQLSVNVMSEWTQAGLISFFAPTAKVFIDGRSQQVYDEEHYRLYTIIISIPPVGRSEQPRYTQMRERLERRVLTALDKFNTEAILLRQSAGTRNLMDLAARSPQWRALFRSPYAVMFVRQGSAFEHTLAVREAAGDLWWPDTPAAQVSRGKLIALLVPEQLPRGIQLAMTAIAADQRYGLGAYPWICGALAQMNRIDDALAYVHNERQRLSLAPKRFRRDAREALLNELAQCQAQLLQWQQRGGS